MPISLSISIVTFNNREIIDKCIESLIKYLPKELDVSIYCIDNASSDGTYENLKAFEKKHEKIRVRKTHYNLGYGGAHNSILEELDSDFHLYCNPDIIAKKNFIEPLIKLINSDKRIGLVVPKILDLNGNSQFLSRRYPGVGDLILRRSPKFIKNIFKKKLSHFEMSDIDSSVITEVPCASGALVLCRTKALKIIKGFDRRYFLYFEDFDMTRMFQEHSYKTIYTPDSIVYHEGGFASRKSVKIVIIHIRSAIQYFQKWGWKF
ncbi:glycosyltransferase family 2 protein [Candidatus Thioglobus sp.]|nr:glycosyltransferase family 2 protein [Candidatus Thioglobus sp.]